MSDLLQQLANGLGEKIAKKYRVPQVKAAASVLGLWAQRSEFIALVESATSEKAVTRTRLYKDAARDATRKVYYELRRYQAEKSLDLLLSGLKTAKTFADQEQARLALVQNHVSTAERMAHIDEFWTTLDKHWAEPTSILDVGCGILPLVYPFDLYPVKRYVALDRSQDSIETIQVYKQVYNRTDLQAHQWHINDGWDIKSLQGKSEPFDVAFMFKLIPVVTRQEIAALDILAQVPAKQLFITGCKTAMVKQQDISKREKASLLLFARKFNFNIINEFETQDEVGLVLKRASV